EEPATVQRLLAFAAERGYEVTGKHHEIYLGDPNRAAAEKLKTLLRYGVRKARG
ncbi:MAG: GyrI-like domain-containing protein, partial [Actinomycetota bacterium]|nr:GyrI-like domain-containing protein [Actinomycetota bacterium]